MSGGADIAIAAVISGSAFLGGLVVYVRDRFAIADLNQDVRDWIGACKWHVRDKNTLQRELLATSAALDASIHRETLRKAQCREAAAKGREAQHIARLDPQARQHIRDTVERLKGCHPAPLRPREDIAAEARAAREERRARAAV